MLKLIGKKFWQFYAQIKNMFIFPYVYSIHNTLYLEVHCPTVKPPLVVISDHGKTTTDFGEVSIGQNIIKSITIQNISRKTIEVK